MEAKQLDKCIGLDFPQRHVSIEYEGNESSMYLLFPFSTVHAHRFNNTTLKFMCEQRAEYLAILEKAGF